VSFIEKKVAYFQTAGEQNTDTLLKKVKEYVEREGVKNIVVASTTGETGAKASRIFKGYNLVVVTHCFGFQKPGETELKEEFKEEILKNGAKIFTGTHALSSVERAKTGAKASRIFKGYNLVVVTHCFGFQKPGETELKEEFKEEILKNGAKIFTGTHALSSVERAIRKDFGTIQPLEVIANTLRLMGEGTKVCVEITLMAADAGLIPVDKDVVAVAGTGRGADTALRIKPANTGRFFDLRIREVIAKPSNF